MDHRRAAAALLGAVVALIAGCGSTGDRAADRELLETPLVRGGLFDDLQRVRTWAYQIQALENATRRAALEQSAYDMFVLEPTRTVQGSTGFNAGGVVSRLKYAGDRRRLVLAYVDIGQAESYRTYWKSWWRAPTATAPGKPNFILAADPDGWDDCFTVAYWDARWQAIIATGGSSILDALLDDGFDGIYLDWVEAYDEPQVIAEAQRDGVNPRTEMVRLIRLIRETAQARNPDFLVIAQNAAPLLAARPAYAGVIDGIAQEDLHFSGESDVPWSSPRSGDIPTPGPDRAWLQSHL
ncbi:MAG: glycoside hydrolase, end-alpha-1,4-polygalactosaminidase, partial [Armatimonadetes bacterium]|nr:glycoside hydrolase, end-alpha-1,4-polygalactosaminidase [Armatimonadota bacterium]